MQFGSHPRHITCSSSFCSSASPLLPAAPPAKGPKQEDQSGLQRRTQRTAGPKPRTRRHSGRRWHEAEEGRRQGGADAKLGRVARDGRRARALLGLAAAFGATAVGRQGGGRYLCGPDSARQGASPSIPRQALGARGRARASAGARSRGSRAVAGGRRGGYPTCVSL